MSVLCLCVVLRASKLVCVAATCLCYCGWYAVYLLYWYESKILTLQTPLQFDVRLRQGAIRRIFRTVYLYYFRFSCIQLCQYCKGLGAVVRPCKSGDLFVQVPASVYPRGSLGGSCVRQKEEERKKKAGPHLTPQRYF